MPSLETKIPPPVVAVFMLVPMWLLSMALPRLQVHSSPRIVTAVVVALIGAAFGIAAVVSFRRVKTTVDPMHPEKAAALVTSGVYRITRNPMYVALLLLLLAWAIFLASPVSLAGPVAFIAFINRFQIEPEEKALAGMFGNAYVQYKSHVRRWL